MSLLDSLIAHPPPLTTDEAGGLRVNGSRVSLDSVIYSFKNGSTVEEIVMHYPSLNLMDVYAVITYYLWHRDEVENYLTEREEQAGEIKEKINALSPWKELRERLLEAKGSN